MPMVAQQTYYYVGEAWIPLAPILFALMLLYHNHKTSEPAGWPLCRSIGGCCRTGMVLLYCVYVLIAAIRYAHTDGLFLGHENWFFALVLIAIIATMLYGFAFAHELWRTRRKDTEPATDDWFFVIVSLVFLVIVHVVSAYLNFI